jgi:hypothetical protein
MPEKSRPSAEWGVRSAPIRRHFRLHPLSCDFNATSCPCGIQIAVAAGVSRFKLLSPE